MWEAFTKCSHSCMSTLNKYISSTLELSLKQEICGELMWSLVLFKFKVGFLFDSPLNRFSLRTLAKFAMTVSQKLGLLMARLQYYMYNANNVKCTVFCLLFVLLHECFDCCCCQFSLPVFPELITTRN